jgi:hypothetical protein
MKSRGLSNYFKQETGVATVTIVAIISLIMAFMSVSVLLVQTDRSGIVHQTAKDNAFSVAEAGINDYLWRVNKNSDYYLNVVHPAQGNDGVGNPKWLAYGNGEYHIDVTQPTDSVPMVTIKATGRKKGSSGAYVTRAITTQIRKKSFTNYIYITNYETLEGSTEVIWWKTGDVIEGPFHTNDNLHTNGTPRFKQKVTIVGILDKTNGTPIFDMGYKEHADPLEFPATNLELNTWAKQGGYYYYGETTIILSGSNLIISNSDASGKTTGPKGTVGFPGNKVIYVDGGNSVKFTGTNGDAYVQGSYSGQLTIAAKNAIYATGDIRYQNATNDMLGLVADNYVRVNHYNAQGQDVTLQGIMTVPANSTLKTGAILKAGTKCTNSADKAASPGGLGGTWTGSASPWTLSADRTTAADRTLAGSLTITAGSKIKTNSTLKTNSSCVNINDIYPIGGSWTGAGPYTLSSDRTMDGDVSPFNIEIDAAIAVVNHSFEFEDSDQGTVRGTLTVKGSIAQKYRGTVGTFNVSNGLNITGYLKNYVFDSRMTYLEPPHFLKPANSGFEIISWLETAQ